ncbi:MAG TPA: pilus assembly protein TadG-related protein [Nonomuraea sp.]|nr:pilus assembly protein TadG-related protein [Nonomuraea sp.]
MNVRRRQQGQILVLFTACLLTILAIGGLVTDAGFAFILRREAQNAADPGAIAAARYIRTGAGQTAEPARMRQAACRAAQENGFFAAAGGNPDGCIPTNDADGAVLTVNYPPSAAAGRFAGNFGTVEVAITRPHQSLLAGLFGVGQINVTSSAVGAYDTGNSNSSSLLSLDPGTTCSAGKVHGTGGVTVHPVIAGTPGGYIHVNSSCSTGSPNTTCSTSGQGALDVAGSGSLTAPIIEVVGTCKRSGTVTGTIKEGDRVIGDPLEDLPPPAFGMPDPGARCGVGGPFTAPTGAGAGGCRFNTAGTINLQPGVYYGGWDIRNNVTIVMAPGIYVIAGGGIRLNAGGSITSVQGGVGVPAPVLLFNTDNPATGTGQADLDLSAQGTLKLRAIDTGPYKGILVWNDGDGSNPTARLTLGGQVSLDIAGTVYSPKGLVTMEGGSGAGSTAAVQIISWQWDVGGNAGLDMPYDPNQLYQFPTKGLVR